MKIALRSLAVALALSAATGCSSNLFGNGDAGAGDAAAAGDASAAAQADAATGADCTGDLGGGVRLCTYVSLCPSLGIDHGQFPNCGFRVRGGVIDMECVCNGVLCPMGAPTTCAQAQQLLSSQSELGVCQQVADGRCTSLGTSTGGKGTCDTECSGRCGGDPSCIQGCGC